VNLVILHGNLCEDPELRFTQSQTPVLNLRMATNERYKDKDGNWKDVAEYHSCVVWGNRGESLSKYLKRGSEVVVRGSLSTRSWEKDGQKRYKTEIKVDDLEFAGPKGEQAQQPRDSGGNGRQGGQRNERPPTQRQQQQRQPKEPDAFGPDDDDVPW